MLEAAGELLAWTAGSGLVVLINPNGLNMWRIPFQTVGVQVLQSLIAEWASPNFHELAQQPLLWMSFLCSSPWGFLTKNWMARILWQ